MELQTVDIANNLTNLDAAATELQAANILESNRYATIDFSNAVKVSNAAIKTNLNNLEVSMVDAIKDDVKNAFLRDDTNMSEAQSEMLAEQVSSTLKTKTKNVLQNRIQSINAFPQGLTPQQASMVSMSRMTSVSTLGDIVLMENLDAVVTAEIFSVDEFPAVPTKGLFGKIGKFFGNDLKNVIPENRSYILFDACCMSSMEVIYELKDKTDYVIASTAEVLNTSFTYDKIVPYLFGDLRDLKERCNQYYEFYNKKEGLERSCTISLIKTKELDKRGQETRAIIEKKANFEINRNIQDFNFIKEIPIEFFDYQDLFDKNFSKEESDRIASILNSSILFKAATPNFLNNKIKEFSGLSISIPQDPKYQDFYKTLSWYNTANVNFF